MRLTFRDGIFIFLSRYDDRHIPKGAGFRWNREEKFWWTSHPERASALVDYADAEARNVLARMHASDASVSGIRMLYSDGWYVLDCDYDQKETAKGLGFRWYKRARRWATRNPWTAYVSIKFATDACRRQLQAWKRDREITLRLSRAQDADINIPSPSGLEYKPFQRAGVKFLSRVRASLLADQMGLGKTIQVIGLINTLPIDEVRNVLIICPASLKINWRRELVGHYDPDDDIRKIGWLTHEDIDVSIATSRNFPQPPLLGSKRIVIINYDILTRRTKVDGEMVNDLREEIASVDWDLVAIDEAHYIKNPNTIRAKAVSKIRGKRKIAVTGTPIVNRIKESWSILKWLRPDIFSNKTEFLERYAGAHMGNYGYKDDGATNLAELQELLRSTVMIRRVKSDVLKELPAKRRQIIEISDPKIIANERSLLGQNPDAFDSFRSRFREVMTAPTDDPQSYAEAVEKLQGGERFMADLSTISRIRHETALAKVPYVIEHIRSCLEQEDSIVVFGWHRDVLESIQRAFIKDCDAQIVHGGHLLPQRQAAVDYFMNRSSCRMIVGNFGQPMGTGWTLTKSSFVVFAELDWVPGVISQAEDRCHRIGQSDGVVVHHVVLEGSLDARIAASLVRKQDIIDRALDRMPEGCHEHTDRKADRNTSIYSVHDARRCPAEPPGNC